MFSPVRGCQLGDEVQYFHPERQRRKGGGGGVSMAEMLRDMGVTTGRKENKQKEMTMAKPTLQRSYAEAVKRPRSKERNTIRVEVRGEEISNNLSKLEHCLVGSWNPSSARGEDLEKLRFLMANTWGLKGKLGLARMEKGRVLLEFEFMGEANRVLTSGKRSVGRIQLCLERWSPRTGCLDEGEIRNEA